MKNNKNGFSTVELLVALFVAAAFLLSGYQLYSYIIKDIGETRLTARATNKSYEILQEWKLRTQNPCVDTYTGTPALPSDAQIAVTNLSHVYVTVKITCPYQSFRTISKVEVILKYGIPQKQVVQVTYVAK